MKKEYAEYLLNKTREDYNLLAEDFSRTRQFFWDIEVLAKYTTNRDKVLDLGCGNGRLLEILKDKKIEYFGLDSSEKLVEIAKRRYPKSKFEVGDVRNLPFLNDCFDKVFFVRTLHHIPSGELRLKAIKEIRRVLKPGGALILTVWNVWGAKNKMNLLRVIKNCLLKIAGNSKLDFGDAFVPWRKIKTKEEVRRYFHFFTKRGLKRLMVKSNFKIKRIWTSNLKGHSDIYLITEK